MCEDKEKGGSPDPGEAEKPDMPEANDSLAVKVAPLAAARRLGDAICLRYSLAFELLRDR